MKKQTLTFLFMLGFMVASMAQTVPGEKLVPGPVKTKFKSEYPSAVLKRWEIKNMVKEYVAVFTDNNLAKRARYKADGTPVLLHTFHPAAAVPAAVYAKVLVEYPGFKVDWANEWKNFKTGNHFFEIRLTKPGYVLHAWVKPDGTVITDEKKTKGELKDAGEDVETEPSQNGN